MFLLHRRICQLNSFYLVVTFLLTAAFLIQLKVIYHSHQKHIRFAAYNERINALSNEMKSVIKIANITSELMKRLQMSLKTKRLTQQIKIS